MKVKNTLAQQEKRVRDWRIISALLMIVVMYQSYSLKTTVNDLIVHIPPSLGIGATMKAGEVPKPTIYSFSHYLFLKISTWEKDGSTEAKALYDLYRPYLTDEFKVYLEDVHDLRTSKGETKGRSRSVREARQKGYDSSKVIQINESKWVVKLDMLIIEKIGQTEVKRVTVRYPIVVVLDNTNPDSNKWGLKFAGFDSEPKRILIKGVS